MTTVAPVILLQSGARFNFHHPEESAFTIEDIAHGLAMVCRFAGHCHRFYSVAQHSVHVSHQVPPELALQALLHDAPEAFIGDMPKPLKEVLPEYKILEASIERAIFDRFKIPRPLAAEVKAADARMYVTEQHALMKNFDVWEHYRGREPYDIALPDWSPLQAKKQFIDRYHELTKGSA